MADKTLIILGDTHVPDILPALPPALLEQLRTTQPDMILHTGDVSSRKVLDQLEAFAPVQAVQGNRDFFLGLKLPKILQLDVNGLSIGLAHGHLSIQQYLRDLFRFMILRHQVNFRYYQRLMHSAFPQADLIIYGHTHIQVDEVMDGQHYLNPGSIYPCKKNKFHPQFATLHISNVGELTVDLHTLE